MPLSLIPISGSSSLLPQCFFSWEEEGREEGGGERRRRKGRLQAASQPPDGAALLGIASQPWAVGWHCGAMGSPCLGKAELSSSLCRHAGIKARTVAHLCGGTVLLEEPLHTPPPPPHPPGRVPGLLHDPPARAATRAARAPPPPPFQGWADGAAPSAPAARTATSTT